MVCKESAIAIIPGAGKPEAKKRRRRIQKTHDVNSRIPPSHILRSLADPSILLVLLCVVSRASMCRSFVSPWGIEHSKTKCQGTQKQLSPLFSSTTPTTETADSAASSSITSTLPSLFPKFSNVLTSNGYVTPTPIQQSSAIFATEGENLLLIAATGSGKTLAYLLPALSRACGDGGLEQMPRKTVLIVAPTRELAAQLARDASLLLPDEINNGEAMQLPNVLLAVRGIPPPTPTQISHATVLIGTPDELYAVLTRISGAQNFLAGDTLSGVILDEVDVLLPPASKTLRTTFDGNSAKRERQTLEQRRKLRAAQRRGVEFHGGSSMKGKSINSMDISDSMNSQVLAPTERVLRLIASGRYVGGEEKRLPLQVLAGSATASRTTLDRMNKALRWAALEGGVIGGEGLEGVWRGRMKVCRPEASNNDAIESASFQPVVESNRDSNTNPATSESTHTIRAVTVPSVVDHRFVFMSKDTATNSNEILANVARVAQKLKPKTSLVFICGEFSRSLLNLKKNEAPKVKGKTSQARRNAKRRRVFIEKQRSNNASGKKGSGGPEPLSVRKACSVLQSMGLDAQPMHVALGLETNAGENSLMTDEDKEEGEHLDEVELPPVLVTFEGSARGLHFDGVDIVFVVGRPTSAASYLHLAGRVGRAVSNDDDVGGTSGEVEVRPGTVVSFCSKGRVTELEKWTGQVGATGLEEIVL
mmetsp:Transcript_23911/g.57668  ORF Transcript_23911/g.57668 Transcript_23911/m.57668 type:complete len:704 (-) Transcript_23911:1018-3129(-)